MTHVKWRDHAIDGAKISCSADVQGRPPFSWQCLLFEEGMVALFKTAASIWCSPKVAIATFSARLCERGHVSFLTFQPQPSDNHFAMWSLLAGPFTRYAVKESERARTPKLNREQLYARICLFHS